MKLSNWYKTAETIYYRIMRRSDQFILDTSDDTFKVSPTWANTIIDLSEIVAVSKGLYSVDVDFPAGDHVCDVIVLDNNASGSEPVSIYGLLVSDNVEVTNLTITSDTAAVKVDTAAILVDVAAIDTKVDEVKDDTATIATTTVGTNGMIGTTVYPNSNAIKAKTDLLNFVGDDVKSTLDGEPVTLGDKTGMVLAADGLDTIAVPEPTGATHNTFVQKFVALYMRFFGQVKSTDQSITVHKSDESVMTTQAVSFDGAIKRVGKAE